ILRAKNDAADKERSSDQAFYESRISEIDNDLALGRIDSDSAEAAKAEEARKLIRLNQNNGQADAVGNDNSRMIFLASFFLPAFSLLVYLSLGTLPSELAAIQQANERKSQTIEELVVSVEKRLKQTPDDVRGWQVVAPVYVRMQRYDDAINAYQNIMRIDGKTPQVTVALGEIYVVRAEGQVVPEAVSLFQETLELAPGNATASFFLGLAEIQNNRADAGLEIWQDLVDKASGDEEWLPVIKQRIAEVRETSASTPSPEQNEIDSDTIAAVSNLPEDERLAMINQMVANLSDKLEEDPENRDGWQRLIRSYLVLNRKDEALAALEKAKQQFAQDQKFTAELDKMVEGLTGQNSTGEN
ncbi:MAG: c-type cytochrome biogenesis protein CcmI, partial [Pseudomonadota bacterium]